MKIAPKPDNEQERINALLAYDILDTEFEQVYDELTELASSICQTPIALISLIDENRQWFKSRVGLEARETNRDIAFCSHAILKQEEVLIVEDATKDERFADNPLVLKNPSIRFYAGAPLITPNGFALGTLCAIDTKPKTLTAAQEKALKILAKQVISQLELRLSFKKLQTYSTELRQINAGKDRFFSIIAHDLKSPFNAMLGFAEILHKDVDNLDDEQIKEISSDIYSTGKSTLKLLDNLLQWSMLETGNLSWRPKRLNLREVVEEVLELLSGTAFHKKIILVNEVSPDINIYGDLIMLESVIQNLVNNAIKFSHMGEKITITCELENNNLVRVIVADSGVGMTQEQMNRLFEIEYTATKLGTEGEKGTGLGLLLCKEFVHRNGGSFRVESDLHQGSRFSFTIPRI
ncbi:GAF domain-containing sensor histidine kinase [Cyanobacterium stanieri LEGE 03274]|uniref:histidine kinase n=1 Tax=Cyanobacterium stanieri LEGE 03274 TaxID=1828756 RepID=A0ABR9V5H4_9CHRO|nr:GAF domain-containing sensor histidine kinase [Cyanobacterium stanieri]MBE9223145.1 GAF domain-containing sensor histidine kinase [Cyanobacterium stanieri LEGE 03274]